MLTFPGPGGYRIDWSPGTVHFPLRQAPSGHLVIPCDSFNDVPKETGGIRTEGIALLASMAAVDSSRSSHSWPLQSNPNIPH